MESGSAQHPSLAEAPSAGADRERQTIDAIDGGVVAGGTRGVSIAGQLRVEEQCLPEGDQVRVGGRIGVEGRDIGTGNGCAEFRVWVLGVCDDESNPAQHERNSENPEDLDHVGSMALVSVLHEVGPRRL